LFALGVPACKLPPGSPPSNSGVVSTALPPENPDITSDSDFDTLGETADGDSAGFLTGLPVGGRVALGSRARTTAWKEHAAQMDAAFSAVGGRLTASPPLTTTSARPMGFGVGYKWSPCESSVVVARKESGTAVADR
jgi:hypothetical protein